MRYCAPAIIAVWQQVEEYLSKKCTPALSRIALCDRSPNRWSNRCWRTRSRPIISRMDSRSGKTYPNAGADVTCFQSLVRCVRISTTAIKISSLSRFSLDICTAGATMEYHLRSTSGSNGLEAEESSPLLGSKPILLLLPGHDLATTTEPVE